MKTLSKLLSIAILLIGINGDACLAQTQTPSPPGKRVQVLFPDRYKCLDLLELERLKVDPQTLTITLNAPTDRQLAVDYRTAVGWFQGFFTAVNLTVQPDGDVTKGTKPYQMMTWTLSYCRSHPSGDLMDAAVELLNAWRGDSTTSR
jgi:hypothetical protein